MHKLLVLSVITAAVTASLNGGSANSATPVKMTLSNVQYWAYNIQHVNTEQQREELVGTHFDLYVLEPVVTEAREGKFDIAALIADIRQYNIDSRGVDPLILAYVDIGQAETWRWYWDSRWRVGNPEWIVGEDPDEWAGCLPVAYWDPVWEDIVIYGYQGQSHIEASLKAGFDGLYMDWVEAFSDDNVGSKARKDGIDPAEAMFKFIRKIRRYARRESPNSHPGFLIVAQNASDLYEENPQRYNSLMDAIACEAVWYDGDGGFDNWQDSSGYNVPTNDLYPGWTEEVLADLDVIKRDMPVFCIEYAQDTDEINCATKVYQQARQHGFVPYASRRSLSRLSTTPYPPGYRPLDY
ncbi:hypothetical protein CSB45_06730 [candidate division KSB3 bacterium]|uniref:Glycoside-hydrolase family GH114 TIM-barrel domain-containing protein n=1 Tax=candidate division KSB3 bacterium TaxID=2044937 RepID=A0A2G6E6W5_9BACT|nr:MAG: hypothetical protein CSB45_06730 [candidate division KSB3 bacterium]PIE30070.1 MAG: hypothetical protein CSA57_05865 [candidate division KSB3 bacterium]